MTRLLGWEERLIKVVARHSALPFAWGGSDCFALCMDDVEALTGVDPMADLRGTYDSEYGATRALVEQGCCDLAELFAKALVEKVAPALARRGDIGIVSQGDCRVGVVVLGSAVVGKHPTIGTVRVPRTRMDMAFKVGW